MASFEQIGRQIDREIEKLRRYLEKEVTPTARRKAAVALRKAAERLADAAKEIEARAAKMNK